MGILSYLSSLPKTLVYSTLTLFRRLLKRKMESPAVVPVRVEENSAAIVFVHGFSGDALKTWGNFPSQLAQETGLKGWDIFSYGYATSIRRVETPGLWSADPNIERLAIGLRTAASLPPLNKYRSLAFIAHSMGGLVVQEALAEPVQLAVHEQLAYRVSHVILFGSPSGGLKKAIIGFLKRQIRDMGTGPSSFFKRARPQWDARFKTTPKDIQGQHPFKFLVVAGDQDEFVPASSSLYPFHERYRRVIPGDHLSIVKPNSSDSPSIQLIIDAFCHNTSQVSALDSARVAVEMGEFHRAIQLFDSHPSELDMPTLVQYGLALDGIGQREKAIKVLTEHGKSHSDALGTLGGRLKRKWRVERRAADANAALVYYEEGYNLALEQQNQSQAYYHAINLSFMHLLFQGNTVVATQWAERALAACEAAVQDNTLWRLTTKGECFLVLRDEEQAFTYYQEALAKGGSPWELRSAYEQAYSVAAHLGMQDSCQNLQRLFGLPTLS
jgi:pimeloyl-ACP methyl ester carboxylesterase